MDQNQSSFAEYSRTICEQQQLKIKRTQDAFFEVFSFLVSDCYKTVAVDKAKEQLTLAFEMYLVARNDIKPPFDPNWDSKRISKKSKIKPI